MSDMTYEQAIKRLDEIVFLLEKNEIELDESLSLFEEGTKLTAFCTKKLNEAKQKISEIEKD
ncbi:MAG: exodeoxyribonuclease VII small subunit [Eubacterium sp.]|nr:exodeoxyribonuclease VII small subunit [Eubacterium sp.]